MTSPSSAGTSYHVIDLEGVKALRDELVIHLMGGWRSRVHGLYESGPPDRSFEPMPSFTCTGIVLQAFTEARRVAEAQSVADRMLDLRLAEGVFPDEKQSKGNPVPHVMCNAWPAFALLECYPTRVDDFKELLAFLLRAQKPAGNWPLVPGQNSNYPIVTGYALRALIKFLSCYGDEVEIGGISDADVAYSIVSGIDFLLRARVQEDGEELPLLWKPDSSSDVVSLGASTMCMHVILKWADTPLSTRLKDAIRTKDERNSLRREIYEAPDWLRKKVVNSFVSLLDGHDWRDEYLVSVANRKLELWDVLAMNEHSLNYAHQYFAPIHLVTLLGLLDQDEIRSHPNCLEYIGYFLDLIRRSRAVVDESRLVGIRGQRTTSSVKTWSTALATIVLSSVLRHAPELASIARAKAENDAHVALVPLEQGLESARSELEAVEATCAKLEERIAEAQAILDEHARDRLPAVYLYTLMWLLVVAPIVVAVLYVAPKDRWVEYEGIVNAVAIIVALITFVFPITSERVQTWLAGIYNSVRRPLAAPRVCNQVRSVLGSKNTVQNP